MSDDTALTVEIVTDEPADPFGGLDIGAMLGGMFPGMAELLTEVNDPDRTTLEDVAEALDELHDKLDWFAAALLGASGRIPGKPLRDLPPYPGAPSGK